MIGYHGYALYQSERAKTRAELIAEDASRGEFAAIVYHSWGTLTRRTRHRGR
jgi:hypothetical protein